MKLPVWLVTASTLIALTASGVGAASAQVSGTFAGTSTEHCISIVPPATFNTSFQPSAPPVFNEAANHAGTWTFNSNGTGEVSLLLATDDTTPVPPGTFVSTNSSAGSSTVTYKFNYTISGGIISTTLVSGSFLQSYSSGPRAGQTATMDVNNQSAYISAVGNHLLTIKNGGFVETKAFSNGDVRPAVCTSSGEIRDGRWEVAAGRSSDPLLLH
jgi:hypothetical protein